LNVVRTFDNFSILEEKIRNDWEHYQSTGQYSNSIRSIIYNSWERCKQMGVNLTSIQTPVIYDRNSLEHLKEKNNLLIETAVPYMKELYSVNSNIGWLLTDKNGVILETKLTNPHSKMLEKVNIFPGTDISEKSIGTNATGISLIVNSPVQLFSAEHLLPSFHMYVSSAGPIFDPITKEKIGILSMGSEKDYVQGHNTMLLEQNIKRIEKMLYSNSLKENYQLFDTVFNTISEPILLFDKNRKVLRYNSIAKQVLEISPESYLHHIIEIPSSRDWIDGLKNDSKGFFKGKNGMDWDILFQPFTREGIVIGWIALFQKMYVLTSTSNRNTTRYQFTNIVTHNKAMIKILNLAKKAAFSDKTVLITGETGTGKELVAQSIHSYGSRNQGPFVEVNCGAISKELVASELFGYVGGAFTGAKAKGVKGKFLHADQGTIFLDEIGDLPLDVQVYLLRVLEERTIIPVGGLNPTPINVRVLAATHKDLEQEVKKGNFREDLYHRLNIINIKIPPLRERTEDIPLLARTFFNKYSEGPSPIVSDEVIQ
ncbi:sigma 54-interacting transcriptional regulator, partial [Neobacillus drentensis]|uniref:sigma-54-dependent Fis family transcriptional regulator n=1 Tax=Neobacillus drentensis TaxID=220684 RepID=UPI0030037A75